MTPLSPDTLIAAANRLITEIGEQVQNTDTLELQRLELCARGLCMQLKAIHELETHNQRMAAIDIGQTYTRYEDLPPLRPEDRARLKQDFIDLLSPRRIEETGDEPLAISQPPKHWN